MHIFFDNTDFTCIFIKCEIITLFAKKNDFRSLCDDASQLIIGGVLKIVAEV